MSHNRINKKRYVDVNDVNINITFLVDPISLKS